MIGKVRPHSDSLKSYSLKSCRLDFRYSDVSGQASTRYTSIRHLTRLRAIEFQPTIVQFGRKSSIFARGSVVPGLIVHSKNRRYHPSNEGWYRKLKRPFGRRPGHSARWSTSKYLSTISYVVFGRYAGERIGPKHTCRLSRHFRRRGQKRIVQLISCLPTAPMTAN